MSFWLRIFATPLASIGIVSNFATGVCWIQFLLVPVNSGIRLLRRYGDLANFGLETRAFERTATGNEGSDDLQRA